MGEFPHFQLFTSHDWGLIIYDEVHLLPAPVFRVTAEIQARRRLGLTATLVREDGREDDVFSLIGPKKYDVPWKDLEQQGWIATADCTEIRVKLPPERAAGLRHGRGRASKYRIAAENPLKLDVLLSRCVERHRDDNVLVIGQYLDQLKQIAAALRRAADHRQDAQPRARAALRRLPRRARSSCWSSPRSPTSPSTCPTPTSPSRSPAPSARARRRRSASAASCAPRPTAARPTSTPSSPATPRTRTSSANRQLFLTEQGYRYNIIDAHEIVPEVDGKVAAEQQLMEREGAGRPARPRPPSAARPAWPPRRARTRTAPAAPRANPPLRPTAPRSAAAARRRSGPRPAPRSPSCPRPAPS